MEEIYIDYPGGFVEPKEPQMKCLLKKSIYGLKQAPRAWHHKFIPYLLQLDFSQSKADSCVFFRRRQGKITILIIYVDDVLALSSCESVKEEIVQYLNKHNEVRVLPATRFIGINIVRDINNKRIFIHQQEIITKVLAIRV